MKNEEKRLYEKVKQLLESYSRDENSHDVMAPLVAEKSLEMNHLYEDMGFANRVEMGRFMKEHFPLLAEKKPQDKLWKKYIYDLVDEVAPACATCDDQATCFKCLVSELSA